jgi:hypothetical protein
MTVVSFRKLCHVNSSHNWGLEVQKLTDNNSLKNTKESSNCLKRDWLMILLFWVLAPCRHVGRCQQVYMAPNPEEHSIILTAAKTLNLTQDCLLNVHYTLNSMHFMNYKSFRGCLYLMSHTLLTSQDHKKSTIFWHNHWVHSAFSPILTCTLIWLQSQMQLKLQLIILVYCTS